MIMAVTFVEGDSSAAKDLSAGTILKCTTWSNNQGDCYIGRKEDLLSAGLVRHDQFPPVDVRGISWVRGERVRRNCRKDETYRRIEMWGYDGLWRVRAGISPVEATARKSAEREKWLAERTAINDKERKEHLRKAERALEDVPRTERAYRLDVLERVRNFVRIALEGAFKPREGHGYVFDEDAAIEIHMSFDAVAEAIMHADVKCDHAKHTGLISKLQAAVVAAGGGAADKIAALTRPSPELLRGEAS